MSFTWKDSTTPINDDLVYRPNQFNTPCPNAQQGWVCPKCGRVNAPWMGTCPCFADKNTIRYNYVIAN